MGKGNAERVAKNAEAWRELEAHYEGEKHSNTGALAARHVYSGSIEENIPVRIEPRLLMPGKGRGNYEIDYLFPSKMSGRATVWGIDEGMAAMLTGMVQGLKSQVILETGTNRGRSTRAILEGTGDDAKMWTIDMIDHAVLQSGAIPERHADKLVCLQGKTPDIFAEAPLASLQGIDFAFLDGVHTKEGVIAELEYLDTHRAPECTVLIDNARDAGWPELWDYFDTEYSGYHHVNLDTMTGTEVITMRN
jgi:predicted O-methyltransferase YrrM